MENTPIVKKYGNVILNGVIVLVFVWVGYKIHTNYNEKIARLESEIKLEKDKNSVVRELRIKNKTLEAYKKLLNNKDVNRLVGQIHSLAKEAGVQMESVRPLDKEDKGIYIRYPFELQVIGPSYHALGRFASKLEVHPAVFTIETSTINQSDPYTSKGKGNSIEMKIKISTLSAKD
jgi:Tfp pilus assembly protein PilO